MKQSDKPLRIIKFQLDKSKYEKIEGTLETYFETGMDCIGLILYDKTKLTPNPSFDPLKPEKDMNFAHFKDWSGIHFISHGDFLQVEDGDIWAMTKDRDFAARDGYHLSFYPCGFTKEDWVNLFITEKVEATLWKKLR